MPTRRGVLGGVLEGALAGAALAGPVMAAPPKLKILILGGTGFTGPHQVRYALARGHEVTIFNRGRQPQDWPGKVEELIGDRNGDLRALEGRTWDVCIDNPTTLPVWVRDAGRVLAGKVKQYVFISTISVYAKNDKAADEGDLTAAYAGKDAMAETPDTLKADPGLYGPLKALSEAEAARQFGKAVTVIRPGLIVGPGDETDRFSYWPVRLANDGHRWGDHVLAAGRRERSGAVYRRPRPRRVDHPHVREPHLRDLQRHGAGEGADHAPHAGRHRRGGRRAPDLHLGQRRLAGAREGLGLGRHAGLDPGRGARPRASRGAIFPGR